jgi:SAM-dependent methyltransferase
LGNAASVDFYNWLRKLIPVKIQEFISSLPQSVITGEDISIPDKVVRKLFTLVNLNKTDIFYDLGCGSNNTVLIAAREFKAKRSVGVEIKKAIAIKARKKIASINNAEIINDDIRNASISDATVILLWFTDPKIVQQMTKRFDKDLKDGVRILTIWSPPTLMLPSSTQFPFFICQKPFKYAKSLKEQIEAIYGNPCIDFTASWLLAEKYIDELGVVPGQYRRFVNILQSMILWINAWNSGVTCENEIPTPVHAYIGILKTFFNIDLSDMILRMEKTNDKSTNQI